MENRVNLYTSCSLYKKMFQLISFRYHNLLAIILFKLSLNLLNIFGINKK